MKAIFGIVLFLILLPNSFSDEPAGRGGPVEEGNGRG